jgi:hypothetical protein
MRVVLCVPHTGIVKAGFAQSLGNMMARSAAAPVICDGKESKLLLTTIFADEGSIDLKRTRLALAAQERGADYILWADADHVFPADALLILMAHDLPFVGCNQPVRNGTDPTARTGGRLIPTTAEKAESGLVEEVGAIGFGFCLMKSAILAKVPTPWFQTTVAPDGALGCGEDVHFCNQARSVGISVHVDHGLSWRVGHNSERYVTMADVAEK